MIGGTTGFSGCRVLGRLALHSTLLLAFLLAACSDTPSDDDDATTGETPPAESQLIVSASRLEFGTVAVGDTGKLPLELTNTGESALLLTVTFPVNPSNQYAASIDGKPVPDSLAPGSTLALSVAFTPTLEGDMPGTLRIDTTDPVTPRVDLALTATASIDAEDRDVDGDGFSTSAGDCDDADEDAYPGADEACDGKDNDCDDAVDEDGLTTYYVDADHDGHGAPDTGYEGCEPGQGASSVDDDCNDASADIYPGALEQCDGTDNDCDAAIDEEVTTVFYNDRDGDGYGDDSSTATGCTAPSGFVALAGDCADGDPDVHPSAEEVCDGIDNDCDGEVDPALDTTWYRDADGDGYGNGTDLQTACEAPDSYVAGSGDCDDADEDAYPGAVEACDGKDNDCDGSIDEESRTTFYQDADGDGRGDPRATVQACAASDGYVDNDDDCNDADASIYPGAVEACDSKDNDCDGATDEEGKSLYYLDYDKDKHGDPIVSILSCDNPSGYVTTGDDCNDRDAAVYPGATETCNSLDDDCDKTVDEGVKTTWYLDADRDGYGNDDEAVEACSKPGSSYTDRGGDCDDLDPGSSPSGTEACDGKDNDCDNAIDEDVLLTFYADADKDGYGDPKVTTAGCTAPKGTVEDDTDCDDTRANVNPGELEACDGLDNDCDRQIDEGVQKTYYQDKDEDGYGVNTSTVQACQAPDGYVTSSSDCNDDSVVIYPGATEACNSVDDDCDGSIDEGVKTTYYVDADKDGYGDPTKPVQACTADGTVPSNTDCADDDPKTYPGAVEQCNGKDNNCNGAVSPPAAPTAGSDSPRCAGSSLGLTASSISGAAYRWTGPNGFTSSLQNPTLSNVSSVNAGTYSVTAIVDGCTSEAGTVSVAVGSPSAAFSPTSPTAAISQPVAFSASQSGVSYAWTFEGGSPGSSTQQNPSVTWSTDGIYGVSLTVTDKGCQATAIGTITVIKYYENCDKYRQSNPSATSGVYSIDPDGSGLNQAYQVYCDMTTDGGGWTLVLNVNTADGTISTLNTPLWTETTEQGSFSNRFSKDYKSLAAMQVKGTALLLVVRGATAAQDATPTGWRSWNLTSSKVFQDFFTIPMGAYNANSTGGCNGGYSGAGTRQTNGIKSTGVKAIYDTFTGYATDIYTNSYYGGCETTGDGFRLSSYYRWANNSNVGLGLQMDSSSTGPYSLEAGSHMTWDSYPNPQRYCTAGCSSCTAYPDGGYSYTTTKAAIGTDHYQNHCTVGQSYRYEWYVK